MNTEVLLARGETVTSFEMPAAGRMKVSWPEPKVLKIAGPAGLKIDSLKAEFKENFANVLSNELLNHLDAAWPTAEKVLSGRNSITLAHWDDTEIEILPQKNSRIKAEIEIDRPRITIQMGQRVDEFSENCKKHLKPELYEHVIRLWSDPDYCRTILPVGRNLIIRGCA